MMNAQNSSQMKSRRISSGLMLMGLVMTLAVSAGCKKSNDNSQQIAGRVGRSSVTAVPVGQTQVNTQTGQVSQTQSAYVTTSSSHAEAFQTQVQSLVSGQLDPQYLGRVSPTDGVMIRGYVEIDPQTGRVMPQNSKISIEIRDEYTNQRDTNGNVMGPVTMSLQAYEGFAYNGRIQLTFQDSVGQIMIVGSYAQGSLLQAQVYFANVRKWDGAAVSMQLTGLGSFQMQVCGFFRC